MNSNDIEIMVCCHKPDYYCDQPGYLPIHVGREISTCPLPMLGDDTGDNISRYNANYCELTAHYWYWKNRVFPKYIGLCHYRRYFAFDKKYRYGMSCYNITEDIIREKPPVIPDINDIMAGTDIILAAPDNFYHSLRANYTMSHIKEDLDILENCLLELYPVYKNTWYNVMCNNNKLSPYNMFITRSEIFNDYSKWLFSVLFEVNKRINISTYPYQARVFGYMSERLLNVYVFHNSLRVKYMPIYKVCETGNRPYYRNFYTTLKKDIISKIIIRDNH